MREKKLNKRWKEVKTFAPIFKVAHVNLSKADDGPNIAHKAIWANYIINYSSVLDQIEGKPELYTLDRIEAWLAVIIECLVSQ